MWMHTSSLLLFIAQFFNWTSLFNKVLKYVLFFGYPNSTFRSSTRPSNYLIGHINFLWPSLWSWINHGQPWEFYQLIQPPCFWITPKESANPLCTSPFTSPISLEFVLIDASTFFGMRKFCPDFHWPRVYVSSPEPFSNSGWFFQFCLESIVQYFSQLVSRVYCEER